MTDQNQQDPAAIKTQLQELIDKSESLKVLSAEARKMRVDLMMKAKPEVMLEFIKVFEAEQAELKKADEAYQKDAEKIGKLIDEANALEKEAKRELRGVAEEEERGEEEKKADDLLKKLDEIQGDE